MHIFLTASSTINLISLASTKVFSSSNDWNSNFVTVTVSSYISMKARSEPYMDCNIFYSKTLLLTFFMPFKT